MPNRISSLSNPKVKKASSLRNKKKRRELGLTIVEGVREVFCALEKAVNVEEIFICQEFLGCDESVDFQEALKKKNIPVTEVSKDVYSKIAYGDREEGVLALIGTPATSLNNVALKNKKPLIVVLESIEKPGNLGAILRTCDGAGVDAVIICDERTDVYNPNVIRSSLGTIFSVDIAVGSKEEVLSFLKSGKIKVISTTPFANSVYTNEKYKESTAIVLGSEQNGLSPFWIDNADEKIKIPMYGSADSLNVSVSTAVIVYEAIRQRKGV